MRKLTLLLILCFNSSTSTAAGQAEVYKYTKSDGSIAFSDRKPANQPYQTLKFDCYACRVNSNVDWYKTPLYPNKYRLEIMAASNNYKIDQALIQAIIHAESSFKPNAISKTGAVGLMQLMPTTARSLGVEQPQNISQNINGGTQYLARLLKSYHGDITLATAAYNAGPSTVKKYNGVPPYPETEAYVERVKILHRRYRM